MMKERIVSILWLLLFVCSLQNVAAQTGAVVYQYWIDNDIENAVTSTADNEALDLTISVADLREGVHFCNVRAQDENGVWGTVVRHLFCIPMLNQQQPKLITGYRYAFNNEWSEVTLPNPVEQYEVNGAFAIPRKQPSSIINDSCHFVFNDNMTVMTRHETMAFAMSFRDQRGNYGVPFTESVTVADTVFAQNQVLTTSASVAIPVQTDGDFSVVRLDIGESATITLKTSSPCYLNLYNQDGILLTKCDTASITSGYSNEYDSGVYYAVVYGNENEVILTAEGESALPEPYAVLSDNNTVLTFYYDDQKEARNGMSVGPFKYNNVNVNSGWFSERETITSVVFDDSFASCTSLTSTAYWFYECRNLTSVTGLQYLNTSNVTDMGSMFGVCRSLKSIDVSSFNTTNVTNMGYMFGGCASLQSLNLNNFNTENVIDMNSMFRQCDYLTTLDLSGFNTSKVTNMWAMFSGSPRLTSIDISSFNTNSVTNMEYMFLGCSDLTTIYAGKEWSVANVKEGAYMFQMSEKLVGGKGTTYDENHVDYTYARIDGGPNSETPGYFTDKNAPAIDVTFDDNGVLAVGGSVSMPDALEAVGGRAEVAKTITAIVWNSTATLTNSDLQGLDNPNMLIFVNSEEQAPANRDNVVIGDFAKTIVLTDVIEGNGNFYCPKEFKAEMISYTRNFQQQTEIGVSRGWESIALPFTVQTIMHEKNGVIAPFGNDASNKHFWLRQLSHQGLERATVIEANWPYIISMPNNSEYPAEFNLAGRVTFSSQDAIVPATQVHGMEMQNEKGEMIVMVSNFQRVSKDARTYALNVGEQRENYPEGSVFEANYRDIRPFEAYTIHEGGQKPAPRFIPIVDMSNGATNIEKVANSQQPIANGMYYDLSGRKLQNNPTRKGVYILNGRKTVLRP